MTRDDAVDAGLAAGGAALHLVAAGLLDRLPPGLGLDLLIVVLPALAGLVAAGALLVRSERRPLAVACVITWFVVLFTLPAFGLGLAFVPAALLLTVALLRPRTAVSSAPPAGA